MKRTFHDSRERVHEELARELVGPAPERSGRPLDLSRPVQFASWEEARGVWHDAATGQEILTETVPSRRFGVGILFPAGTEAEERVEAPGLDVTGVTTPGLDDTDVENKQAKIVNQGEAEQDDDLDLRLANLRLPSTLGLSVCGSVPADSQVVVSAEIGRYRPFPVVIADSERQWWVRTPVTIRAVFPAERLAVPGNERRQVWPHPRSAIENGDGLEVEINAFSRVVNGDHLITITLTNRSSGSKDEASLFQAGFEITAEDGAAFLPYPENHGRRELSEEEQSIALLYRRHQTFALGHGCAADWEREPLDSVQRIKAVCLPSFEAPSVTPDIVLPGGERLSVSMQALAEPALQGEASSQIERLISGYETWIADRRKNSLELPQEHRAAAERHLRDCDRALERMRRGWKLIREDSEAALAFRLANEAMLIQQARSAVKVRETTVDASGSVQVAGAMPKGEVPEGRGNWRPFQIAFLLAVVESVAVPGSDDRETVELIFFPTGGGKTEAYLAVAAFAMFLRRLRDPSDTGTEVIMRYTLRLLTAQQFSRAASLICAMEVIRSGRTDLGGKPYSIGVWLGGSTTPNTRDQAVKSWDQLVTKPNTAPNDFLLLRCPWCAAKMGPTDGQKQSGSQGRRGRRVPRVVPGYRKLRDRVTLHCPDERCPFHKALPTLVVDDDIYEAPPSMIIGTVDKFATMAWQPCSRALFGLDESGEQQVSPPGLIIQDEFHLISGPLGSMVGLYESVIETLCTDDRTPEPVKPKIVSSTATIRRYQEQVAAVYARNDVALFPPPGLEASDSFFSVWARDNDGQLLPGRRYVGVHAPALGSMQSVQVRVAAAMLQAPAILAEEQRDPWWTSLWFFNSLRELGNSLSLLQADIPDYLVGLRRRDGLERNRFPRSIMELTSRRRNDEIPRAIDELSVVYGAGNVVDICLASNIIEVGVDIDRLSLMAIVGQPKTTAQYIQVSGRVGRRWDERPGLVISLYGAAKPRDRSHYERFRTYHERLYSQVEPTSVTPFALPVMKRALHAALISYVRLVGGDGLLPWPFPEQLTSEAAKILLDRAYKVDFNERKAAERTVNERLDEWEQWEPSEWRADARAGDPRNGLMRFAGEPAPGQQTGTSWEVPASMRNVDAECKAAITRSYNRSDDYQGDS
ncbi:hypothetical protein GCM10023195_73800 [Actinoallomurus liliacearum]|uniref:Helicase C-terminal domain-containing protein n=1 Tax=Actinoallomurus liliacearum TaxID=1080073 RepID=A0ABP8TYA2_9ACTN